MHLIPFSREHFEILAAWFPDEAAIIQWGGPKLSSPLDTPQMEQMLAECQIIPPARLCWMAVHNNVLIGHAQLAFDWKCGNATLGRVAIAPDQRGHGYAQFMLKPVIDIAFSYPQIMRLELNVYSFNTAAIHTYEKLGFVFEGTRRYSVPVGNQRWHTNMMAVLRQEYNPSV
jgi:RimJ/RimL family protein N-acetyltransferase